MKKGNLKSNFLFIVGISVVVIILFSVGFATFYEDNSFVFDNNGYIINSTENSSDSYSFASGTKYKTNLSNDIAFEDTSNKSVSVASASFVHYENGALSFLQNGALLDLDKVNEDYVPYYNVSNKFVINYENGTYSITNDTKSLEFTNWIGRISDSKYIVVGKNLSLKIPGVNKSIEGEYFELLFMTDGVVKIDNQDVSYQVTAQGSTIYVGDNIRIDLGENQIFYNGDSKMLLSQITISGDENIDLDDGTGGAGGGSGSGDGSGVSNSGITSGTSGTGGGAGGSGDGSGVSTSGTTSGTSGTGGGAGGSGDGSGVSTSGTTSGTSGTGEGAGGSGGAAGGAGGAGGSGEGSGDGEGSGGSGSGKETTASATIELIKLDVSAISMHATLQMNRSSLISGSLVAYLTNINTGQRTELDIAKQDGTLEICSEGDDCYSFGTSLLPDNQYLLSIVDVNNNKQYFQKLITTSELGVTLEKVYATSSSLTYNVKYDVKVDTESEDGTKKSVSQVDFYLYDELGEEVYKELAITDTKNVTIPGLSDYSKYKAVIKNVSVCDDSDNCNFDDNYELTRDYDWTLKKTPNIEGISVKQNTESATFDLSATVRDSEKYSTITKYIYTVCREVTDEEVAEGVDPECFTREKTDSDALSIKVGEDIVSGVVYVYTFKVQYNDGQMERQVPYNGSVLFSMESMPYFQTSEKEVTSNSIYAKLVLVDPSCTVPMKGRICKNKPEMNASNTFTLKYYKLADGEELAKELTLTRDDFKIDAENEQYYYELNLSNLASESRYAIKILGTYELNGELRNEAQIGNELYIDTAATGNLKFVYTANSSGGSDGSDDTMVINYNAKLSGGSLEDEETGDQETEEGENEEGENQENSLSALNSIQKLTFDLYAGSYADDSETNNRHLGETFVMQGNANIKKTFCGSVDSIECDVAYNFNNGKFGIANLDALMKATGELSNFCTSKESFGCLATSYTVVVKGYDGAGNVINIDNETYTYDITPSYYVSTQLRYHTDMKSIVIDSIVKEEFKTGDSYDFSEILDSVEDNLKNKKSYQENLELIDDETVVGIQIFASIPKNYIDAVYEYDKVATNYYICNIDEENCNSDTALEMASVENTDYSDSNYIFYLNDSDFVRGKAYKVMYELVFTSSDGVTSKYSNSYTIVDNYEIKRQAPIYNFYIMNSTKNTITYAYNIKDVDGAIDKSDYYFYYSVAAGKPEKGEAYTLNETRQVTFKICEDTCNGYKYNIYLKEKLIGDTGDYVSIVEDIFDGEYSASETDKFELLTYDSDNRLYIKLDDSELGSRTSLYRVRLSNSDGKNFYDKYYLASKLGVCSTTSEADSEIADISIVCEKNPGDYKYITVDFANKDVAANIGKNITVSVDSYYNSGLVGMLQTFNNGLLLQNTTFEKGLYSSKYLNVYYSSGLDTSVAADVIYQVSGGSWAFGNNNTINLYNILDLKNASDYNSLYGADYYTGSADSVSRNFVLYPLTNRVGFRLDSYSNYNPKVVNISTLSYDNNKFKFDSIIPKVGTKETRGINSLGIDFEFDGVSEYTLSSQFKKENGKYYLYVNLYDSDNNIVKENVKVEIKINDDTVSANVLFSDLDVKTSYKYDIWAYMKSGNTYNKVQVYDKSYSDSYVKTTYETSTLNEEELLSKVVFKANAVAYNNLGESISDKQISYNVRVTNGAKLKIRLGLYDKNGTLVNFNGTKCDDENSCYVEIMDSSNSIASMTDNITVYKFNTNDYVFGDNYYTLKVYAIPYYSDIGYDTSKMLTLYDSVLVSKNQGKEEIDVGELEQSSFNVSDLSSTCTGSGSNIKCSIKFSINGVKDPDFVMKNGEYHISLYDNNSDIVYTIKNQNGKTVRTKSGASEGTVIRETAKLYVGNSLKDLEFPDLKNNTQYSIEISYDTYRNNVSFGDNEDKKKSVSPYTDYVYTPISAGITLGNVIISKESNTSFKLLYNGSTNINDIKRVDYKVNLSSSTNSTFGEIVVSSTKKAIFTASGNNYYLLVDFVNSNNSTFTFSNSGTYNISITYYKDVAGTEKIYSSTFSILV